MTTPAAQPPEPIDWRDLIATGRVTLIPQSPGTQPGAAALRRAVSTAYYAMFHALAASNADALMGTPNDELTTDAWVQIYRGLNHNQTRAQLQQNQARMSAKLPRPSPRYSPSSKASDTTPITIHWLLSMPGQQPAG